MSSKIHCTCTATVLENWTEIAPTGAGKPYLEAKLQLDDENRNGQRWDGRFVFVKSWSQRQYLPDLTQGTRVFVSGSVDARGYMSKQNKPAAMLSIIADRVEVEAIRDALPAPIPASELRNNPQPATAATSKRPIDDDDDVPF